ncbi:MAG: hypothetical protein ACLFQK_09315 [Fibrobacterota bacterium]
MENIYIATGKAISNRDVSSWHHFILENLDSETDNITFDFKDLAYPVSSFFGMIFSLHKYINISNYSARIKISNCSESNRELLVKLNFGKVADFSFS